jgi:hypothetical protein
VEVEPVGNLRLHAVRLRTWAWLGTGVVVLAAVVLLAMGRVPWCTCGTLELWHGVVASSENSQHLSDPYTFTHVVHGFGFYALLRLAARRWPVGLRGLVALVLEAGWEVLENTNWVIERYREATISLDYYGDSVVNSLGDMAAMVVGFALAARLPVRAIVAITLASELILGILIRDNLTLNIVMLIYPFESIKRWQMGG